jgi:type II secretory pathway component PulK
MIKFLKKPKPSEKGVALMMALFFTTVISFLLFEISKETLYEAISASQRIHELRAYYAAKAGEDVSLLRIKAFQMIKSQIDSAGDMGKPFADKANIIWEFPFVWPPVLPDGSPLNAQNELKTTLTETFFKKVSYAPLIQDMGGLIDINNLDSPSKALAESTKKLILELYRKKIEADDNFSKEYNIDEVTIVINNMIDWIDEDQESLNGGGESAIYTSRQLLNIPPNQHFKVLSEILLVEGMNQELFSVIEKSITTLGNPGINVNAAEKEVLMSLDPRMNDDTVNELIRRRQDIEHGPFNESLLQELIQEKLGDFSSFNPSKIPILYTAVANFRIESIGTSGKITKTLISHVYDQTELLENMVAGLKKEYDEKNPNPNAPANQNQTNPNSTTSTTTTKKAARVIPPGPPPVVYRKVF